jgi:hypothetical protein
MRALVLSQVEVQLLGCACGRGRVLGPAGGLVRRFDGTDGAAQLGRQHARQQPTPHTDATNTHPSLTTGAASTPTMTPWFA